MNQMTINVPDDMILNVDLVAEMLGITPKTVRRWFQENKLPSCNPGGHHRVKGKDLKEFIKNKPKRTRNSAVQVSYPKKYNEWLTKAVLTGEKLGTSLLDSILDFKFYKSKDIAKELGVSTAAVRLYVSQGKLKSLNSGGRHIIQGKDLKQFLYERIISERG